MPDKIVSDQTAGLVAALGLGVDQPLRQMRRPSPFTATPWLVDAPQPVVAAPVAPVAVAKPDAVSIQPVTGTASGGLASLLPPVAAVPSVPLSASALQAIGAYDPQFKGLGAVY